MTRLDRWCQRTFFAVVARMRVGRFTLIDEHGHAHHFGHEAEPSAQVRVHHRRFYRRIITGGEAGFGESYVDGDWSTPDLVGAIRLLIVNQHVLTTLPGVATLVARVRARLGHRRRDNTRDGSRRNIRAHYDLGNEFFRLFLDANLLYSCAVFEQADESLEQAQINKLRAICEALQLGPEDHVLEIGTGWGGFALYAATRHGCRVTTTTISAEQHAYARRQFDQAGAAGGLIDLRFEDYRDLRGQFTKIVSIEMFEAVGLKHYDSFFRACDRLLDDDGVMLLQTITVDDWRFDAYRREPGWIAEHIFPGSELASVAEILASVARVTRMGLHQSRQIGTHYALTLHHWRQRFLARLDEVRAQGFDDRFIRMWDVYLAYCEAAFATRHIGDVHLLFAKSGSRRILPGETPPLSTAPSEADVDEPVSVRR